MHRTPQNVRLFQVKFSPPCSPRRARGDLPPLSLFLSSFSTFPLLRHHQPSQPPVTCATSLTAGEDAYVRGRSRRNAAADRRIAVENAGGNGSARLLSSLNLHRDTIFSRRSFADAKARCRAPETPPDDDDGQRTKAARPSQFSIGEKSSVSFRVRSFFFFFYLPTYSAALSRPRAALLLIVTRTNDTLSERRNDR